MDVVIKRRPVSVPILPVLAAVVVIVMLLVSMRIGVVQGNEVGILVNNLTGGIEVRTEPGAQVYNGLITDFYAIDNTVQTVRMVDEDGVNIKTRDGADVTLDVELNYRLLQDAIVLRDKVVPESGLRELPERMGRRSAVVDAYKVKWIRDYARSVIRYTFGELGTGEFYNATERDSKAQKSREELNRLLGPHGLEVVVVVPDKFRFYEEYEQKIAQKKEADQEAISQREKAKAALKDQVRQEVEARARATVEIETARGQLKKELLTAEAEAKKVTLAAEAYAYTTRTAAEADLFRARNEAESIVAQAQATAEGIRKLAESFAGEGADNLVKLEYAKALSKARLSGEPYAKDPVIQKVDVTNAAGASRGGRQ